MKIVIAGGDAQAEFLVSMFKSPKNQIIAINPDPRVADTITRRYRLPVYVGDPTRKYVLQEADAFDADVFIALCNDDTDDFACCILAQRVFDAKKCICVVHNPKNVEIFKRLGIDSVISSSYLLGQSVQSESSMANLVRTLSLENDRISVIEAVVLSKYEIANRLLKDCRFPKYVSVAAIYRNAEVIIPKGDTIVLPHDKLMLVCSPADEKKVMAFVRKEREAA